ncbi:MAG: ribosomal protein S18-alanine N-acetyltransferase [Nitrospirales bacterium]|nr:ribosomal protein S18-alanine N-acetyltransferase [Nitrospirales bacterium]
MSEKDVPVIADIEKMTHTMPWADTSFYSEVYHRYSLTRIAELEGRVVGYICVRQIADECHLLNLTVHPDFRRRGIATLLFTGIMEDLRKSGGRFLYLEVRASNHEAKSLYEKFGFTMVGIRKNYYIRPEENALVMMREIGPPSPA